MNGDEPGSKFSRVLIWGRRCRGVKNAKPAFLSRLIENSKLYNVSKSEPLKSIRRGDMEGFLHFDLEKRLFLLYLLIKLNKKVEIWYVSLAETLNMPFGNLDFSTPLGPFTAPSFSHFLSLFFA